MSKEYCIFLRDRFSTPRIARVDSILGDTINITESGYGYHNHSIKSNQIVGFGSRKELIRMFTFVYNDGISNLINVVRNYQNDKQR